MFVCEDSQRAAADNVVHPPPARSTVPWRSFLEPARRDAAFAVARAVASRLRDPARIEHAVAMAQAQTTLPLRAMYWEPYGLAQGYAGLALMCAGLDACFPEEDWALVGHRYLELATQGLDDHPGIGVGLHAGLSGVAFAGWWLSRQGRRYRALLASLDARLAAQALAQARWLSAQRGVSVGSYDLISGLTGTGAYLLCRIDTPALRQMLLAVLAALVAIAETDGALPRWHTPARLLMDPSMSALFPEGNLNCGLAHGIPGPLALLALARSVGATVPGQEAAIARLGAWLAAHRADDAWGINWPSAVALPGGDGSAGQGERPSRAAWCYGSPGVARALWCAGQALDRADFRGLAVAAMESVYRKPPAARMIDSPTFCHGVAGLLHVTLRFAHETGGAPLFVQAAQALTDQLLALYEPESLVGYRRFEPSGARVDNPGLLDGAAGVVLVLLAAAGIMPAWDRCFLLA